MQYDSDFVKKIDLEDLSKNSRGTEESLLLGNSGGAGESVHYGNSGALESHCCLETVGVLDTPNQQTWKQSITLSSIVQNTN